MLKGNNHRLKEDFSFLIIGLFIAVLLWHNNVIDSVLASLSEARLLSAFIAGLFFTSGFTTLPAVAFMAKVAQITPPITVALLGALGAVIGDAAIFYFVRERLAEDFMETLKKPRIKRINHLLKSKIIRFSLGIVSGVLIALPLPTDETAFTIMGLSRTKTYMFLIIAFTANFLAIYIMASLAHYFVA